jgi:hypothetical protein
MSTDLSDGQTATTLLGKDITVTINGDGVFINEAKVIVADNGVVHVIDAVLLPPAATGLIDLNGKSKDLTIHPNPAVDFIRLSGLNNVDNASMKIIDMSGAVKKSLFLHDVSQPIDISSLKQGAYFMVLDSPEGRYTGKLIVK